MDVVFVTKNGMVKRTSVEEFRAQGRGAQGVRAIRLKENDTVVAVVAA